ncbi:MAG: DNA polymerase III subunit alpha [Burkholderiales bacterium]
MSAPAPALPPFVHLRLHSEYSVTDGIVRVEDAVAAAGADGMPAVALTDLANVFGAIKFYKEARGAGLKPLIGCDLWIENDAERDKPHRLLVLCQSRAGWLRLSALLTRAFRENQYRGRAEVKRAWFGEAPTDGLIALSGALSGDVGQALAAGNRAQALACAQGWARLFPQRYYVELQRLAPVGQAQEGAALQLERYVQAVLPLAAELKLPSVATHPVQFLTVDDFDAHEARVCIARGEILADQRRPRLYSPAQYFKSRAEMGALFADLPQALANSVEVAKRCNLTFELGKSRLPQFPTPNGESLEEYLRHAAGSGLAQRLARLYPDDAKRAEQTPLYQQRLEFEIKTIQQMGFAGYFLIVADFINWAKGNGVPVGPGRGSGAGSLVAYSLGITDLDPLRYDLLFERFLNPERVSMPDFDIDFCQEGRDRVIEYVRGKYGTDSVSQIVTFGTMAAKAVVRDVGRVLDLGFNFCDQFAKLIPFQPGRVTTLHRRRGEGEANVIYAREVEPQINAREKEEEEIARLLELAERLEGLTRNVGMHAGGVLIAPGKLTDFCPLYVAEGASAPVSQFDMKDVEAVGLVKFDFLGLTTLTILDWAQRYVRKLDAAAEVRLDAIPLDDAATYKLFAAADTTAIFQFESRGMRDLLKKARPDRFEDLIALVALYRPGPMDLIPEFVERKHGKRVEYPDPRVKPILEPTYGIMVYQEQVMQMAQVIGGYSLGGADLLRRAMGKKLPEEMAEHRGLFTEGAAKNGVSEPKARSIFDLMEKFAGYGFNKSHAAAYALVAYQTAWFKAHHAAAFAAANLSAVMADTDKVQQFVDDLRLHGLKLVAPDVNRSNYRFEPLDRETIEYGLGAIKGTGESAIQSIVQGRAEAPYQSLFDFCERVDRRLVNRRVVEALVRAGAFDSLAEGGLEARASLLASVGIALERAEQIAASEGQNNLFGDTPEARGDTTLVATPHWNARDRLANEKLALGFYLSGHPFEGYRREFSRFVRQRLDQLQPRNESVLLAGVVHSMRTQMTRRGKMAVLTLDDGYARVEMTVFNEVWEQARAWLKEDQVLLVEGKVANDEFSGGLRVSADKVFDLAAARARFVRGMRIQCNGESSGARLKELLAPYRNGPCPVTVVYSNPRATCEIELGPEWRVKLEDGLLESLAGWVSDENVEVVYQ